MALLSVLNIVTDCIFSEALNSPHFQISGFLSWTPVEQLPTDALFYLPHVGPKNKT